MTGLDNRIVQTERSLFALGLMAKQLGLDALFSEHVDDDALLSAIARSDRGSDRLRQLDAFLRTDGWRTLGNWDASNPTWIEKPSMVVPSIRRYVQQGAFMADETRPRLWPD